MKRLFLPLLIFLASGHLVVCGQQVLMRLGRAKVTDREFEYLFRKNHLNRPEDFTEEGVKAYLGMYTDFKLKVLEAARLGLDTTRAFKDEFRGYRKDIRKTFEPAVTNPEQLLSEAYDRLKSEIRASHILIRAESETTDTLDAYRRTLELRERALRGEDFSDLARRFSEDPSARQNGGDLGYFTAFNMVYPFENAAYGTPVGGISMPVRTRFGFHLVKVVDIRQAPPETEVSHILVRHGDKVRSEAEAKEIIFSISDRLQAGGSWDEICREFSEDPASRERGGRLPPFRKGQFSAAAPEFEEVALSMEKPGEVSDPVQSSFGWHIIRFEKRMPMRSLQEMRMVLQQQVNRDERSRYSGVKRLEKLKANLNFREQPAVVSGVFALADSNLTQGRWMYRGDRSLGNSSLFSLDGQDVSVERFFDYIGRHQASGMGGDPAQAIRRLYAGFVQQEVERVSDQKLERENEQYRLLLNEYREGMMLFSVMEREVWNRAAEDTLGQNRFYQEHMSRYQAGDRIRARLFGSGDVNFMRAIRPRLERGDSLTPAEMRRFRTVSPYRNFERGDSKVTDKVPWQPGWHETEVDRIQYLVHVEGLVPPGQKTLEEARPSVISDYQDELERNWLRQLRRRFPVRLNDKVLSLVVSRISSSRTETKPSSK